MAREAVAGRLRVGTDPLPLERVEETWQRLQAESHRKIVLVPRGAYARTYILIFLQAVR